MGLVWGLALVRTIAAIRHGGTDCGLTDPVEEPGSRLKCQQFHKKS